MSSPSNGFHVTLREGSQGPVWVISDPRTGDAAIIDHGGRISWSTSRPSVALKSLAKALSEWHRADNAHFGGVNAVKLATFLGL